MLTKTTSPIINRRRFLEGSLLGGTALLAACNGAALPEAQVKAAPYNGKLGIQLYTLRDQFEADFESVFKALAQIGYKDLEFAGYFEHDPKAVKALMDDLGLVSNSTHVQLADMKDNFDQAVEIAAMMGQTNLIIPWIKPEERTLDGYRAIADLLNERGGPAKAAGMTVGYHNHEFEFENVDGTIPYDLLLERTDPETVTMELDLYWTELAGVNPIDLFKKAPGRFSACHIKDAAADGRMVTIGDGIIDFATIFAESELAGLKYFYVENDNPEDGIAFARGSYEFLES